MLSAQTEGRAESFGDCSHTKQDGDPKGEDD